MNQTFHEFEISICNLSWNEHRNWFYLKAPLHITSSGCGYNLVQPTRHRPRRYKRWKESSDDTHSVVNNERINKQLNHEGYGKLDSSFLRKFFYINFISPLRAYSLLPWPCAWWVCPWLSRSSSWTPSPRPPSPPPEVSSWPAPPEALPPSPPELSSSEVWLPRSLLCSRSLRHSSSNSVSRPKSFLSNTLF